VYRKRFSVLGSPLSVNAFGALEVPSCDWRRSNPTLHKTKGGASGSRSFPVWVKASRSFQYQVSNLYLCGKGSILSVTSLIVM
jgi:hypothetical protein